MAFPSFFDALGDIRPHCGHRSPSNGSLHFLQRGNWETTIVQGYRRVMSSARATASFAGDLRLFLHTTDRPQVPAKIGVALRYEPSPRRFIACDIKPGHGPFLAAGRH